MASDTTRRRRILLTNDDGINSPGLKSLLSELAGSCDVRVAAPEEQQSGTGHAVTLHEPISVREVAVGGTQGFAVRGTPADCVKVALTSLLPDFRPDLVVSGINGGPNVGRNVLYSGTVAAALEAVINGVPAVAVSMDIGDRFDFAMAAQLAAPIISAAMERGLPPLVALNVNIPNRPRAEVRGVRVVRQGNAGFREYYVELPAEDGRRRFMIDGTMEFGGDDIEADSVALACGYITVSTLGLHLNDGPALDLIRSWPEFR